MQRIAGSRWFGLADLILVGLSGVIWYFRPEAGGWPLLIALLPWGIRLGAGRFPFRNSSFDIPLIIFLITAGIGVWVAFNQEDAWVKFCVLVGAVFFFYALAGQPKENLWLVVGVLGLVGTAISLLFALTHDWRQIPNDISLLYRVGIWLMKTRPAWSGPGIGQNIAGGILAMLLPFSLALGLQAWGRRKFIWFLFAVASGGLIGVGLLLTSSRGAWLALGAALGLWFIWGLCGYLARQSGRARPVILAICLVLLSAPICILVVTFPGGLVGLADLLPGLPSGGSRLELAQSAVQLISDFPFTGGGLKSFGGLYSQYIMVTPFFLYAYSHNFYLDVALEQGVVGGLVVVGIMIKGAWLLTRQALAAAEEDAMRLLSLAALASLVVVLLHGLVDDALYGESGTLLVFLPAGIAVALQPGAHLRAARSADLDVRRVRGPRQRGIAPGQLAGVALVVLLLVVFLAFNQPILAAWYANLGAVQMARVELAGWPTNQWNASTDVSPLDPAGKSLQMALNSDPENRTAHHRVGLIALQRQDFEAAIADLEKGYTKDPGHRGLRKALGYSYVWAGELENAGVLLDDIPEAPQEMEVYAWWWREHGRRDLANQASEMVKILQGQG